MYHHVTTNTERDPVRVITDEAVRDTQNAREDMMQASPSDLVWAYSKTLI